MSLDATQARYVSLRATRAQRTVVPISGCSRGRKIASILPNECSNVPRKAARKAVDER